jgi:hypothetical protein
MISSSQNSRQEDGGKEIVLFLGTAYELFDAVTVSPWR